MTLAPILGSASSAIVFICIDLYWRTCSHVIVRKTKKTLQCPQTLFPHEGGVWGRDYRECSCTWWCAIVRNSSSHFVYTSATIMKYFWRPLYSVSTHSDLQVPYKQSVCFASYQLVFQIPSCFICIFTEFCALSSVLLSRLCHKVHG